MILQAITAVFLIGLGITLFIVANYLKKSNFGSKQSASWITALSFLLGN